MPYNGTYLINLQINGLNRKARSYIRINGEEATYTDIYDPDSNSQVASPSIVLHMLTGQEVTVDPNFTGTIAGNSNRLVTWMSIMMLYPDVD